MKSRPLSGLALVAIAAFILSSALTSPASAAVPRGADGARVGPVSAAAAPATPNPQLTRLSGATRYETAVAVSKQFSSPQKTVFVTTGADFPDALSAAAAAGALDAPVLLTPTSRIPATVISELRRLKPTVVYVLGGPTVVSASVVSKLSSIAPTRRIYGATRYQTSQLIAQRFTASADRVILATGRGYADALAASAAAGAQKFPALLIDGTKGALDAGTLATLQRWSTKTVWLAGGHGAISIPIEQQLRTLGFDVRRYGGASRYDTAAAITAALGPKNPQEVFLATGEDFPDALTAAALSAQRNAALHLTRPACVPTAPRAAIASQSALPRVVIGGTAVVSAAAAQNKGCGEPTPSVPTWKTSNFSFSTTAEAPYTDRAPVDVHNDPSIVLDSTGLRVINMGKGGSRVDHPVAFAQYGISALLEYQATGEGVWLDRALRHAERLVQIHTDRDEAWFFPYLFDWTYSLGTLKAPWWSAMGQGEALSLFVRLYEETGDAQWRTAADHTWLSFLEPRSVTEPWGTFVDGDLLWFEEYAGKIAPLKVFNGHVFALFGVYDYWKLTGDATALQYLDGATTSTLAVMPRIRASGGLSYYCWNAACRRSVWQYPLYHSIHIWQLDTIARLTGDSSFAQWADVLHSDRNPDGLRTLNANIDGLMPNDEGTIKNAE